MNKSALIYEEQEKIAPVIGGLGIFDSLLSTDNLQQALSFLEEHRIDMIYAVASSSSCLRGLGEFLKNLQKRNAWSDIPSLIFIDEDDRSARLGMLEAGARDILPVEACREEIVLRTRNQLRQRARVEQLRQDREQLAKLALTDSLTGLYNRAYFDATLDIELARTQRSEVPCCLMLLDLDHFKTINDTLGHVQGDFVLKQVAQTLRNALRRSDVISRFGGEEFAVILPATAASDAFTLAERLRQQILQISSAPELKGFRLSVSIGITVCPGGQEMQARKFIEEADCALYAGKRNGRNRTEIFGRNKPYRRTDDTVNVPSSIGTA